MILFLHTAGKKSYVNISTFFFLFFHIKIFPTYMRKNAMCQSGYSNALETATAAHLSSSERA